MVGRLAFVGVCFSGIAGPAAEVHDVTLAAELKLKTALQEGHQFLIRSPDVGAVRAAQPNQTVTGASAAEAFVGLGGEDLAFVEPTFGRLGDHRAVRGGDEGFKLQAVGPKPLDAHVAVAVHLTFHVGREVFLHRGDRAATGFELLRDGARIAVDNLPRITFLIAQILQCGGQSARRGPVGGDRGEGGEEQAEAGRKKHGRAGEGAVIVSMLSQTSIRGPLGPDPHAACF